MRQELACCLQRLANGQKSASWENEGQRNKVAKGQIRAVCYFKAVAFTWSERGVLSEEIL